MYTLEIRSDPNTNNKIDRVRVRVLNFATQEGGTRGGAIPGAVGSRRRHRQRARRSPGSAARKAAAVVAPGEKTNSSQCEPSRTILRAPLVYSLLLSASATGPISVARKRPMKLAHSFSVIFSLSFAMVFFIFFILLSTAFIIMAYITNKQIYIFISTSEYFFPFLSLS